MQHHVGCELHIDAFLVERGVAATGVDEATQPQLKLTDMTQVLKKPLLALMKSGLP